MIVQCNAAGYADTTITSTTGRDSTSVPDEKLSREKVFGLISEILNSPSSNQSSTGTSTCNKDDIVTALSLMQHNIDTLLFDTELGGFRSDSKVIDDFDRLLRNNMMSNTINKTDEDTIDVVKMMFDIIFEDSRLSNKTKTLLAKLQIPVLKVAFLDDNYFSDNPHPAEQLINKLTDKAISLAKTGDKNTKYFHHEVTAIVSKITHEFIDDTSIFSDILKSSQLFEKEIKTNSPLQQLKDTTNRLRALSDKMQNTKNTENIKNTMSVNIKNISDIKLSPVVTRPDPAKEVAKHTENTDKLITNAIRKKIIEYELPREVRDFLTTTWASVATTVYNNHSDKSEIWKTTILVVDQLAWIFQPKSKNERRKITNIIPRLVTNIQNGLDSTNSEDKYKTKLFTTLLAIHAETLKEQRLAQHANVE